MVRAGGSLGYIGDCTLGAFDCKEWPSGAVVTIRDYTTGPFMMVVSTAGVGVVLSNNFCSFYCTLIHRP